MEHHRNGFERLRNLTADCLLWRTVRVNPRMAPSACPQGQEPLFPF